MADIEKIVLPNGDEYNIKDAEARQATLLAVYTSATQDLQLLFDSPANADNIQY